MSEQINPDLVEQAYALAAEEHENAEDGTEKYWYMSDLRYKERIIRQLCLTIGKLEGQLYTANLKHDAYVAAMQELTHTNNKYAEHLYQYAIEEN